MILSDLTINDLIRRGDLSIDPFEPSSVQPASLDLRLGRHYLVIEDNKMSVMTLDSEVIYRDIVGDNIVIPPHSFLLATTLESITMPQDLTAFVEGRSSIGRIGLFVQNAGWVDPGFAGTLTLELYNANSLPIRLDVGRRICQLVFCRMDQAASVPYRGKYQGQSRTIGGKAHLDDEVGLAAD